LFSFEASWLEEHQYQEVVQMAWENGRWESEVKVVDAIRSIATGLQDWSVNMLGDLEKRLKKAKTELEGCRRRSIS
jgi:hypothetical protein